MYSDPYLVAAIKHRVFDLGESRNHVARSEGMSRNTVRSLLRCVESRRMHRRTDPTKALLTPFCAKIDSLFSPPESRSMTAIEIFRWLRANTGYAGSYSTVVAYIGMTRAWQSKVWLTLAQQVKALPECVASQWLEAVMRNADPAISITALRHSILAVKPLVRTTLSGQESWSAWLYAVERQEVPALKSLTAAQWQDLKPRLTGHSPAHRRIALTVLAHDQGFSARQISLHLGVSRNSVRRYLLAYSLEGPGVFLRKARAKQSDDESLKKLVFEALHEPPSAHGFNRTSWRMEDLRLAVAAKGRSVCEDVIHTVIKEAGFRWRHARKVLTSNDPDYREKLAYVQDLLRGLQPDERFFSIDEYGPFAIKVKGGRTRVAPGTEYTVPQWQKSKGWLILTAALELSSNQVTHFYSKAKNTAEMIRMAKTLIDQYRGERRIYLSWDAASWHQSKRLRAFMVEHNATAEAEGLPLLDLAPLPAGAQFLNVIESIFSGMARAIIHNSNYASVDDAKGAIDRYFAERNAHFVAHPGQAGKKLWGREMSISAFDPANNCKSPAYR